MIEIDKNPKEVSMAKQDDFASDALDFCDALNGLCRPSDLIDTFKSAIARFGLDHFIVTDLPKMDQRFEQAVLMRHWPAGWYEAYAGGNYVRFDPVIRLCRATTSFFEWTEVRYNPEREPRAHEVMQRAADFGLARGLSLPVHGLDGLETCFSVSGRNPELPRRFLPALHLMMLYTFERLRQIVADQAKSTNPLTAREREVLCWAANGKSASEMADLMSITERTVNAHAGAAIAKLNVNNRTQAVVAAMLHRYIRL